MKYLLMVLWTKIVITILFWAIPLALAPGALFPRLGFPEPAPMVWARLLGWSFAALVVGYLYGVGQCRRGVWPTQTVAVGIVSNGSSSLVLLWFGVAGEWQEWGRWAQVGMWGSAAATGVIALSLALCWWQYGKA